MTKPKFTLSTPFVFKVHSSNSYNTLENNNNNQRNNNLLKEATAWHKQFTLSLSHPSPFLTIVNKFLRHKTSLFHLRWMDGSSVVFVDGRETDCLKLEPPSIHSNNNKFPSSIFPNLLQFQFTFSL